MLVIYHTLIHSSDGQIRSVKKFEKEIDAETAVLALLVILAGEEYRDDRPKVFSKGATPYQWDEKSLWDSLQENVEYGILLAGNDSWLDTHNPVGNKRKKIEKSQSPGSRLDSSAGNPNLLATAIEVYKETLSSMSTEIDLFRTPKLGVLTKVDLPHTDGDIDMRFSVGSDVTPVGAQLIKHIKDSTRDVLLIGKSGCGKTSAIFDAAAVGYCLLFTASSDNKTLVPRRDPGGFDFSFAKVVADARDILEDTSLSDDVKERRCDYRILALIVARMLLLYRFSTMDGATPKAWLVYQLSRDIHLKTDALYLSLVKCENSTLEALRGKLTNAIDFFFALDEAQVGYTLLKEQLFWKRSNGDALGIASPFLQMLGSKRVVIAGTALSLHSVPSCESDLGKPADHLRLDNFPPVSLAEIKQRLSTLLAVSDDDLDQVNSLWKLEGRGRLLGGLIGTLADLVFDEEAPPCKVNLLEAAVKRHYNAMKNQLMSRTMAVLQPEVRASPLRQPHDRRQFPECLESLAIAFLLGGTVSKLASGFNIDLLEKGLCSLKQMNDGDHFVLDEEFGKDAIMDLALDNKCIADIFKKIAQLCRPCTSNAMEPLLVAEMRAWSLRNEDATVETFLSQLFDVLPNNMPDWIEHSKFHVAGGFSKHSFISPYRVIKNDVDFVRTAFTESALRNHLLSPSTMKRPDFEAVMVEEEPSSFWFLSVSYNVAGFATAKL